MGSTHSCLPSPLAPDPIRVQSCVCCLFWTNRNSMAVTSIFSIYLITQLELWILQSPLSVNGNIYFYWNYSEPSILGYHSGLSSRQLYYCKFISSYTVLKVWVYIIPVKWFFIFGSLNGVFAKNERGYRLNAIKKHFWSLLKP